MSRRVARSAKKPTYGAAIRWIAANDAPGDCDDVPELEGYLTVALVADVWGRTPFEVAVDVQRTRHGAGPFAKHEEGVGE